MIDAFESTARMYPDRVFLSFVDESGAEHSFTYRESRLVAATMARRLRGKGVRRGDYLSVDLPNCPEFVFLALAAAYGSFVLVCINHRLTPSEKMSRLFDLEREGVNVSLRMDQPRVRRLMDYAWRVLEVGEYDAESVDDGLSSGSHNSRRFGPNGTQRRNSERLYRRTIMGIQEDAITDSIHFAEREAHLFDSEQPALLMFTSGTTGKSKAVQLTWEQLVYSAESSNQILSRRGRGLWQAVLPLYHIGGFQVLVRSVTNLTPIRLYARFEPERVLWDAVVLGATHISVVDKMLRDLMNADSKGVLTDYQCILLGGGPLNAATVAQALKLQAPVYASYGMTETASQIANARITPEFTGGLNLLPGYTVRIIDPDEDGFGRLAVKGFSVFDGYLTGHTPLTVDGYFLTGDTAALFDNQLFIRERTEDMFISGGENIYPAEIARALSQLPGVKDSYIFGVPDETWGRRPVAFVEVGSAIDKPTVTGPALRQALVPTMSKISLPKQMLPIREFPRIGIGKIDRKSLEDLYEHRLEASKIQLYHIRLPFRQPFATARSTLTHRDLMLVEVIDHAGRSGLGECTAFATDWYLPETLPDDARVLHEELAPSLLGEAFLHPREVSKVLQASPTGATHPMACSALEMAFWDLWGKIEGKPFWMQLNDEYEAMTGVRLSRGNGVDADIPTSIAVHAGAVVGMGSPRDTVQAVQACVDAGYKRVKLKISPGQGWVCAQAVRNRFPHLLVTLDANQSFSTSDFEELRAYDVLNIAWIEEPLNLRNLAVRDLDQAYRQISSLQRFVATPICIDESFTNYAEAMQALSYGDIHIVTMKIGKFGGIQNALRFFVEAQRRGRDVWMSGMYDTGISRRVHAAFQTLPGLVLPGDIGSVSRYFTVDVTEPPYHADQGMILLNDSEYECGIGCRLNRDAMAQVLVEQVVIE